MLLKPEFEIMKREGKDGVTDVGTLFYNYTDADGYEKPRQGKDTVYTILDRDAADIMFSAAAGVLIAKNELKFPRLYVERFDTIPMYLVQADEPHMVHVYAASHITRAIAAQGLLNFNKLLGNGEPLAMIAPMPPEFKVLGCSIARNNPGNADLSHASLYPSTHGTALVYVGLPFKMTSAKALTGRTLSVIVKEAAQSVHDGATSFLLQSCPVTSEHYDHYRETSNGRIFNLKEGESAVMLGALQVSLTSANEFNFLPFHALQEHLRTEYFNSGAEVAQQFDPLGSAHIIH